MKTLPLLTLAALAAAVGCQPSQPYDHYWSAQHCSVSFDSTTDWSGMHVARAVRASAYLRRANGASSLLVQLDGYGSGIAEPYPGGPTVRFAVPPGSGPGDLGVVLDASDVRGPTVVAPGTAWLIQTDGADTSKPEDNWRFGQGTLRVETLALTENDTDDRDLVSLDAAFDLTGVTVAPLSGEASTDPSDAPKPVGGKLRLRCADQALVAPEGGLENDAGDDDASVPDGGADDGAQDAGDEAEAGPSACGKSGSCANPACGDCDGDTANFCETELRTSDHCGSCGRSCGPGGSCSPLGACGGQSVATGTATAVAIGSAGVGFLGQSVGVRFAPTGGSPNVLAAGGTYSTQDALVIDGGDLYYASYAGLSRVPLPNGAPVGVAGAIDPDSIRLIGATSTHLYALTLNEQGARDVVRRYDRTTYTSELVACLTIGTYDAAVSPSGALFVSTGAALTRYDGVVGGSSCLSTTSGTSLVSSTLQEAIVRVVAGTTRVFYARAQAGGAAVLSLDASGQGTPTSLGVAAASPIGGPLPLACDGDTVFWATVSTPGGGALVVSGDGGAPLAYAATNAAVVGLAASPAGIAWTDVTGIFRVSR
ncbi:MAG: hypothetical protein OZ921_04645 [Sorangiineae bacterium]|nr:hypothetical protein [Polyangiaceae bacterium]MEB2321780.1 hypothetical protein [Sorangiineae bacterium]